MKQKFDTEEYKEFDQELYLEQVMFHVYKPKS